MVAHITFTAENIAPMLLNIPLSRFNMAYKWICHGFKFGF